MIIWPQPTMEYNDSSIADMSINLGNDCIFHQVVGVILANDKDQYISVQMDRMGRYLISIFTGRGKASMVLDAVPLMPGGVIIDNPCKQAQPGAPPYSVYCNEFWTATAIIPAQYLPYNVTKFVK